MAVHIAADARRAEVPHGARFLSPSALRAASTRSIHRAVYAGVALGAVLVLGGCTSSTAGGGRDSGGLVHAAGTPLRDVGLLRPEIPDALKELHYPYHLTAPGGDCAAVQRAIADLDTLLGEESYQPGPERSLGDRAQKAAGDYAVSTVADGAADILPYRGWVRRLSGASRAERRAAAAYALGEQRRTFLRGYAAGLGCPLALPPPPPDEAAPARPAAPPDKAAQARPAAPPNDAAQAQPANEGAKAGG